MSVSRQISVREYENKQKKKSGNKEYHIQHTISFIQI